MAFMTVERRRRPSTSNPFVATCPRSRGLGATGEARWEAHGRRAFNWFLGQNHLHQWLYDTSTGGCRDALHVDRMNQNQGAEATLSFLLALCEMRATTEIQVHDTTALVQQLTS
jgi:hypothetical protein